jgi:hypothetical protein
MQVAELLKPPVRAFYVVAYYSILVAVVKKRKKANSS